MTIINEKLWKDWEEKNTDNYGKCCVDVARKVMEILDEEKEFDVHEIVCQADRDIDAGGITGFMAGCVAEMVSKCHSRGDEFRLAWNKDHGIDEGEAKGGVINPALVTIDIREKGEKDDNTN